MNKKFDLSICRNWCIFLYFIVLFVERVMSIYGSLMDSELAMFNSLFSIYSYGATFLSLVVALILLVTQNTSFIVALFTMDERRQSEVNFKRLSVLIGVLLVSGMIHTAHTTVWLQFVAYGFLIIGLIIATIKNQRHDKSDFMQWLSVLYLIAYSMAIPVVYESRIPNHLAFHIVEIVASLVMIALFSFMTYKVFAGKARNLMYIEPLHIAMFLDIAVIWLRWSEEINYFVMISLIVTIVLWLIGRYRKPYIEMLH